MNKEGILQTGFRLIGILAILYKEDATKAEIKNFFYEKYNLKFSDETLKLDLNTLESAGFKLTRGTKTTGYKISLEKDFKLFKLTKEEEILLSVVKDAGFEYLNYKQVLNLENFYKKISKYVIFENNNMCDFKFCNLINHKILNDVEKIIKKDSMCIFLYDSPRRGKIEIEVYPKEIVSRGGRIYINCLAKKYKGRATFRLDNIKDVKKISKKPDFKKYDKEQRPIRYVVKRDYYENFPMEKFEKVIKISKDFVVIEAIDKDEFFIIQRLLTLGKNCVKVNRKSIRNKVLDKLTETLEVYKNVEHA